MYATNFSILKEENAVREGTRITVKELRRFLENKPEDSYIFVTSYDNQKHREFLYVKDYDNETGSKPVEEEIEIAKVSLDSPLRN